MKILLVCSIFPPDIGGPAIYAEKLAREFEKNDNYVSIISGRNSRSFMKLFGQLKDIDICYVLTSSPGLIAPAFFAAKFRRKKLAIRIGGDFPWERALEAGRTRLPLRIFYAEYKKFLKEQIIFLVLKYFLRYSDFLIFASDFQKNLYIRYYNIKNSCAAVIENPYPAIQRRARIFATSPLIVLYAGRLLKLKNLDTLIYAFADLKRKTDQEIILKIIGEGPEEQNLRGIAGKFSLDKSIIFEKSMPQNVLFQNIKQCWLAVLPSISEIFPNFVLEACAHASPILITRETGLPNNITEKLVAFEPENKEMLSALMFSFLNPSKWREYQNRIMQIDTTRDMSRVCQEHISIFNARV